MRPLGLTAHLASWMVQAPGSRRKLCLIAPGGKWPRMTQEGSLWCSTQGQAHTGVHAHRHTHITHTICAYAHVNTYTQILLVENLIWSTCYLISIPYFYLHESHLLLVVYWLHWMLGIPSDIDIEHWELCAWLTHLVFSSIRTKVYLFGLGSGMTQRILLSLN